MAGVVYRALTNENPPDAVSRLKNDAVPARLAQLKGRVSEAALRAVDWALALDEKQRPASVEVWKRALLGKATVPLLTRTTAVPAATALTRTAGHSPVASEVRRTTLRPRSEAPKPTSGWRWVGIGLALLVALAGSRAWYTQREAKETAKLEAARAEIERLAEAQRQADRRGIEEREARLLDKERSAAEREEAARRAADREDVLRRLDEERAARERIASAGDARRLSAPDDARRAPAPLAEKRDFPPPLSPPRIEERPPLYGDGGVDGVDRKMEQGFRHMDANGDGHLTPDEVRGRGPLEHDFSRIDTNGDGRISIREFMSFRPSRPPQKFK